MPLKRFVLDIETDVFETIMFVPHEASQYSGLTLSLNATRAATRNGEQVLMRLVASDTLPLGFVGSDYVSPGVPAKNEAPKMLETKLGHFLVGDGPWHLYRFRDLFIQGIRQPNDLYVLYHEWGGYYPAAFTNEKDADKRMAELVQEFYKRKETREEYGQRLVAHPERLYVGELFSEKTNDAGTIAKGDSIWSEDDWNVALASVPVLSPNPIYVIYSEYHRAYWPVAYRRQGSAIAAAREVVKQLANKSMGEERRALVPVPTSLGVFAEKEKGFETDGFNIVAKEGGWYILFNEDTKTTVPGKRHRGPMYTIHHDTFAGVWPVAFIYEQTARKHLKNIVTKYTGKFRTEIISALVGVPREVNYYRYKDRSDAKPKSKPVVKVDSKTLAVAKAPKASKPKPVMYRDGWRLDYLFMGAAKGIDAGWYHVIREGKTGNVYKTMYTHRDTGVKAFGLFMDKLGAGNIPPEDVRGTPDQVDASHWPDKAN